MSPDSYILIFGDRTAADWHATRALLNADNPKNWDLAYTDFFLERLKLRYLEPIAILQSSGTSRGEGFAIMAIQCSLIEFLESTAQGVNYKYSRSDQDVGKFEYKNSKDIFVSFLTKQKPFSEYFDQITAQEFYVSVRCGLLHEAKTKNNWRIWDRSSAGIIVNASEKIVYRDAFQDALISYLHDYRARLRDDSNHQAAFIRKMDNLCA